jgi:hypothetical protein
MLNSLITYLKAVMCQAFASSKSCLRLATNLGHVGMRFATEIIKHYAVFPLPHFLALPGKAPFPMIPCIKRDMYKKTRKVFVGLAQHILILFCSYSAY